MRITCPSCGTTYDVAEGAIGPNGRKVRCRACGAHWIEPPRQPPPGEPAAAAVVPPGPAALSDPPAVPPPVPATAMRTPAPAPPAPPAPAAAPALRRRGLRPPLVALMLVVVAIALGLAIAGIAWGPQRLASQLGLAGRRVPLGIAITRQPDWREIAGGSELFAVSGRIWNPTAEAQPVPDVRAEIRDGRGHVVRAWRIARPARTLPPGGHVDFDAAAVDVPRDSATVALSFAGEGG